MTIAMTSDIDVLTKYSSLITDSLGSESVYIRTKETLQELLTGGSIKDTDKANVIAQVLTALNTSMVQGSMQTALQWATQEKEIELKKLELEKQLDLLMEEKLVKEATVDKLKYDTIVTQSTNIRANGMPIVMNGQVTSLSETGTAFEQAKLLKAQAINESKNGTLIDNRVKESNANIHKIVADTYINYGTFSGYVISENGVTGVNDTTPAEVVTLSSLQASIAKEQAKGYAWNAWSNAASGLGATIGTAMTSETNIFGDATGQYQDLLIDWAATIKKLKDVTVPVL